MKARISQVVAHLMSELNFEDGDWQAVQIGPETVGWIGPHAEKMHPDLAEAQIRVFTGDETINLNLFALCLALISGGFENTDIVTKMINYTRRFAVRVPVGSLDSEPGSVISYTPRTTENLHTALHKLFSAASRMIQADLHKCNTPIEVVRKCAELDAHGYPHELWEDFTWRGILLDDLFQRTKMKVRVLKNYAPLPEGRNPYHNIDFGALRLLPYCSYFGSFVSWQTRNGYDVSRTAPENVFLIRATSPAEYEEGRQLLQEDTSLTNLLAARKREGVKDATFFLCPAGDPLEEWVDGEWVTAKGFLDLAGKKFEQKQEDEEPQNVRVAFE